jgi:hypothetical protein
MVYKTIIYLKTYTTTAYSVFFVTSLQPPQVLL